MRKPRRKGRIDLLRFYARRVRRLLPASALLLLGVVIAGAVLLTPFEQVLFSGTALGTSLYVSNIWFMRQSFDYFSPSVEANPLLHTWSLAVEEQFYLVWPVLVLLALRFGRGTTRVLVNVMACVTIVSFAAAVWLSYADPIVAFFSLPTRAWEFGVGSLATLIPQSRLAGFRCLPSRRRVGARPRPGKRRAVDARHHVPGVLGVARRSRDVLRTRGRSRGPK